MKKNIRDIVIVELIILVFVLILKIIVFERYPYLVNYVNMFFWFFLAASLFLIFGFPKDKNYFKNITIKSVIIYLLSYLIFTYLLGLFTGFVYTTFSLDVVSIFRNIFPVFVYIIVKEFVRYILCKKAGKNIKPVVLLTILYIIFDIIMVINNYNFVGFEQLFVFIFLTFVPIVAKELLCMYMTYNISLIPSIIYYLAMDLIVYVLPIYPDLGNYISSVLGLLFPFILYLRVSSFVKYNKKVNINLKHDILGLVCIPISIFLMVIVVLVSGVFSYKMIAIGSDSMNPIYYKGDAVIYEKLDSDMIKEKDILVFETNGVVVTHRVKNIIKKGNVTYFQTKGDNNKDIDKDLVSEEDILGVVKYIVKYVGYPTIWINEKF